jgi:hypothetical protein
MKNVFFFAQAGTASLRVSGALRGAAHRPQIFVFFNSDFFCNFAVENIIKN